MHACGNFLNVSKGNGGFIRIPLVEHDLHSHIAKELFYHEMFASLHDPTAFALVDCSVNQLLIHILLQKTMTWSNLKTIIDRVHKLVYGHSNFQNT